MPLHLWALLWAGAGLLAWLTPPPEHFATAFPTALYLAGLLASLRARRFGLALAAAPLLYAGLLAAGAPAERVWPLCVLLSLQVFGGSGLGALVLCLLTYAIQMHDLLWVAVGSAALISHALLLGYLRNRGRLDPLLVRSQELLWMILKAVTVAIVLVAFVACTGGGGLFVVFLLRGFLSGAKKEKKQN